MTDSARHATAPEDVYRGEILAFPGPWRFQLEKETIILVSDAELEALADPDRVLNLTLTFEPRRGSLQQVCERAQKNGVQTLVIAFDHFFSQYRPGQAGPRRFMPDSDEYIKRMADISRFAAGYGLKLELSLLSPLEIGPAYRAKTGESGLWLHYRKGVLDPTTGAFSVQLWQQRQWANNKGVIELEDAGARVFAFEEQRLDGTPYRVVAPESIVEISDTAAVGRFDGAVVKTGDFVAQRIRVHGRGARGLGGRNRVLVVQQYRTPEMDYFSEQALPFLKTLVDRYLDAGVRLSGFYSDEMHIQGDWHYFGHHDHGQFALRYVSDGLARRFATTYGEQYRDLARYMIYFCYGQEDFVNDLSARSGVMHVFGPTPQDIRRTALFRARYYRFLQDGVVDLFLAAKRHAEQRVGYRLDTRAHATWAESPTIDCWDSGRGNPARHQYEYTANFVWSNTVHQAASACHDYFKWGDYLTGGGNDHAEGGWADRDYFGLALACSTGILNEVPYAYAAHWGMPEELARRRQALVNVFGACAAPTFSIVQEAQHRDVDVLMLYPIDLVAVEERFGSWMTQYAYANYVTQQKLLERGRVRNGAVEMAGRRFTTLVATFEPFPALALLEMMGEVAENGGRVIWFGPPPVLASDGSDTLTAWGALFGVRYEPGPEEGKMAPGRLVEFEGALASVTPQVILTDFLVDHIYPVAPTAPDTSTVARVKGEVVGTLRKLAGGGSAVFLGYRPRDDQAASLGYESRNWFEVLTVLGAYPPSGKFDGVNDNTEYLSRTTPYLCCRFPNGAVAITRHFKDMEEGWDGGFARNEEADRRYLEKNPPPTETLSLREFKVNGHAVSYDGTQAMSFRVNERGELVAFAGSGCRAIVVDGREFVFADRPLEHIAWAPVPAERRVPDGAILLAKVNGTGIVRIPLEDGTVRLQLVVEGARPGDRGDIIPSRIEHGALVFEASEEISGRWLYGVRTNE